jgi:hypothetical protein
MLAVLVVISLWCTCWLPETRGTSLQVLSHGGRSRS